jgi:paraquat-inducible protein B
MSKKANKTAIGAFVVGAAALCIIAVLVFGSGALFKKSEKYVLFFDGSVNGLSIGAPVVFKGVKLGTVSEIILLYDQKTKGTLIAIIADLELSIVKGDPTGPEKLEYQNYKELVERGLRARLESQSFVTGQLMLSFDFYPDKPVMLRGLYRKYPELPTIPITPSILAVMGEVPIKEIGENIRRITAAIDKLFSSGEVQDDFFIFKKMLQEITRTARSIRMLAELLEQHPESILKGKPELKGGRHDAK